MPPRPQEIHVDHRGKSFAFQIHARELEFGRAGKDRYYWMDGRQLRQGAAGPNFRPCVDLWWHVVTNAGQDRNPSNEMTRVLAECYPLVNTAKALQDIYTDAHLHRHADREYTVESVGEVRGHQSERMYSLPDEEVSRVQRIAHQRNAELIRTELEQVFLGPLPSPEEMPAFREAAQAWIGNGIRALRLGGPEELGRYTNTLDEWIRKLRRRAGLNRERMFLNMFSYECKAAFYFSYAQAWIGIFHTLQRSGQLDAIGERFMRLWHHQNQAAAEGQRDVFCGQIVALHPLSGIVHGSPQHLAVIGEYLALPEWESLSAGGKLAETKEYRDVIATILVFARKLPA